MLLDVGLCAQLATSSSLQTALLSVVEGGGGAVGQIIRAKRTHRAIYVYRVTLE